MRDRRILGRILLAMITTGSMVAIVTTPAGAQTSRVTDAKDGFSFSLPASWQQIPLSGNDVNGLIGLATKNDPSSKSFLTNEVRQALKTGVKVFAVGPASHGFAPNINVLVTSSKGFPPGPSYFDELGLQLKVGLSSEGLQHVGTSVVKLRLGKEIEATYKLPMRLSGGTAYGVQLYFNRHSHLYISTYTAATLPLAMTISRAVADSWRWT